MEAKGKSEFTLPVSEENIYNFCYWAGQEESHLTKQGVAEKTIQKNLYGLKAWQFYHNQKYPTATEAKVAVMLQDSA
jgi:hypothetical protein